MVNFTLQGQLSGCDRDWMACKTQKIYCLTLYRKTLLIHDLFWSMKVGYSQCKTMYEKLWILCKISIMLVKIVTLTVDSRDSKGILLESELEQVGNRPNYTLREKSFCFVLFRYQPFALWADKYCLSFNASVAACCTHWKYKIYSDVCSLFLMTKAGLIA